MKNQEAMKNFGTHLRKLREEKKLSQQKLADMANIHKSTIHSIENARYCVTLDVLVSIAIALEVPITRITDFKIQ